MIATRLRAVSETYDDSVVEYYEPDDAADLARAIRRLRAEPERRAELVRNAKAMLEQTGWAVQREIYLQVFDDVLGGPMATAESSPSRVNGVGRGAGSRMHVKQPDAP